MEFSFNEDLEAMRELARDFTEEKIAPNADQWDKDHHFPIEVVHQMGELGFFGCPIPEEYGGSNLGFLAHTVATEEISRVSGSIRAAFNMQTMGTSREIFQFGTDEQKEKFIPKLVRAEHLGCIGITEPNAGSDVANMKTRAVKKADRYILTGSKTWITFAQVADIGVIYAYTDPSKQHKGISAFIVDMHSPGITVGPTAVKMGWHACPTGEIYFDEVEVPEENLLGGEEGKGFQYAMSGLNNTRLTAAAGAVGVSRGLIDEAVTYAKEREQFGRPIGTFTMVQEELARSLTRALLPRRRSDAEELYRGGTDDLAACDLNLACRQNWYSRNIDQLWQAVEQCEQSVERDPEFALAWSGLADAIDALAFRDVRAEDLVPRAMAAAQRAVLLDPELGEGWASWGTLASEMERDWATAELALRRAIERKPSNAYARAMLGDMLRNQGRVKEAIEQQRAALRLDPLSPVIHGVLAISLTAAREYEEARSLFERTLAAGGDQAAARQFLLLSGPLFGLTGAEMAGHAVELSRMMGARDPESAQVLGHAFAATAGGTGRTDGRLIEDAGQEAEVLIADSVFNARQSAVIYTRLGDVNAALQWLERAAAANDLSLGMASTDPSLDPLREDPRMQRLMDELHLPNGYDPSKDDYKPEGSR